ncbi:MAG: YgfZ/GcvT domain-containing protein [Casimicrobiaceae bacterium]
MNSPWSDFLATRGASFDRDVVASFGAPGDELAAARDDAVLCDLSPLAALQVAGPDATTFLQGQLTNDVAALGPDAAAYGAWCSPKGRMLVNFVIRRRGDASYEILLPASLRETIAKRLRMFVLRSRVVVSDDDGTTIRLGIGGPGASAAIAAALDVAPAVHRAAAHGDRVVVALPGPRYIVAAGPDDAAACWARLAAIARPAGFAVWRWLTIRAGVPVVTPPTADLFVPQAANWDALGGISFQKGCYAGQEIVARTQYLGRLKERLALAHLDAAPPEPGERLYSAAFADQACGTIVDAADAPDGGSDALAVLQTAASASGDVHLGARDGPPLRLLELPYGVPAPTAPRGRIA